MRTVTRFNLKQKAILHGGDLRSTPACKTSSKECEGTAAQQTL
jgi:hypothetical protein